MVIGFRVLSSLTIAILFYKTWIFFEKIGKIKLWQAYYILFTITSYFLLLFPTFTHILDKNKFSIQYVNLYFICMVFSILVYKTFLNDKEKIKNRFLIS